MEQARVTADAVTRCLRALAAVADDAALVEVLEGLDVVLAEVIGSDGVALAAGAGSHRVLAATGALGDLRAGEELPGLVAQLEDAIGEVADLDVRSHSGTRRRSGRLTCARSDGIVLLVTGGDGPHDLLPTLTAVIDVELRRRTAISELTDRVRELEAHRSVQAVLQEPLSLPGLLEAVVAAVHRGLRHPAVARVEIELDGRRARSGVDAELADERTTHLSVEGVPSGWLRVGYAAPQRLSEHEEALAEAVAETVEVHLGRERARRGRTEVAGRLASLVRSAALAIVSLDPAGTVTSWNHGAERLLGWTSEEVLGTELLTLVPPEPTGAGARAVREAIDHGAAVETVALRLRHRDGRHRELEASLSPLLDDDGRPSGASVICRDVEERNAALRRLAENEELFRLLADSSQDVVYRVALGDEPRVEYASPSARERLGFRAADLVADPSAFTSRVHPEDRRNVVGAGSWATPAPTRLRYRFRHADGRWLWLDDRRSPLVDHEGRLLGVSGVMRDVTAEVESERRLRAALDRERRAADELRRVDVIKTTFLSAASHELRTPLTSILGFAHTAERTLAGRSGTDPVQNYVRRIVTNAERLEELIGDLVDVDRLARQPREPAHVRLDVVALVGEVVRSTDAGGHTISSEVPDRCDADVDADLIERIVRCLLDNAVRHTPAGTEVTVRVAAGDDRLALVVEDDGPGVPEEERARLFAPFAQGEGAATAANPGTGIGLALVERFARVHGGHVDLDERPGGGARFTVDLPRWARTDA